MKYLYLPLLFVFIILMSLVTPAQGKIILNPDKASKVMLTHGYKGVFCMVGTTDTMINPLTLYFGTIPQDVQQEYDAMSHTTPCLNGTKEDVIVGDVAIHYEKGYDSNETFFVLQDNMYRSGGRFYSVYPDPSEGGTWHDSFFQKDEKGIEYMGSSYFFPANYQNNVASSGAALDNTGYLRHFDKSGVEDSVLLVFQKNIYRRLSISEEKNNEVLIDYSSSTTPTEITNQPTATPIASPTAQPTFVSPTVLPTFPSITIEASPSSAISPTVTQ